MGCDRSRNRMLVVDVNRFNDSPLDLAPIQGGQSAASVKVTVIARIVSAQ
jgi:hypothetical protein